MMRMTALIFAYLFLALALAGLFIPGLPTVPFLLLTAWFAARGSDRLHRWLYAHPTLGKLLTDWEREKALSRKSKWLAVSMLMLSWLFMYAQRSHIGLLAGLAFFFITIAAYLISRPEPTSSQ